MNEEKQRLPIIYGAIGDYNYTGNGVQGFVVDGQDGKILTSHFCTSENFAKSDLGFSTPLFEKVAFSNDTHSTVHFNHSTHKLYSEKYPDGYELVWLGNYNDRSDIYNFIQTALDNHVNSII